MMELAIGLGLGLSMGYVIARMIRTEARFEGRLRLLENMGLRHGAEIKTLEARFNRHIETSRPEKVWTDAEPLVVIEKEGGE